MTDASFYTAQDPNVDYDSAQAWANVAKDWAIKLDGPVQGSDFSAQYWAIQAAASAAQAAAQEQQARVDLVAAQEELGQARQDINDLQDELQDALARITALEV